MASDVATADHVGNLLGRTNDVKPVESPCCCDRCIRNARLDNQQVYPLLVAVGGGVTVCAAHLTRMVFFSPDCL